jgi:hypothetical protein
MHACAAVPGLPFRRTQHNTWRVLLKRCTGNGLRVLRENGKDVGVLGLQITGFAMLAVVLCPAPASCCQCTLGTWLLMNHGGVQSVTASLLFSISLFLGAARSDENGWNRNHAVSSNNTLVELKAFGRMALAPVGRENSAAVCASFQYCTSISEKKG